MVRWLRWRSSMIKNTVKDKLAPSKATIVEKMLSRAHGASILDMASATGWQAHSCRAFLTGLRKKGREITRLKRKDGTPSYHIMKVKTAKRGAGSTNGKPGREAG